MKFLFSLALLLSLSSAWAQNEAAVSVIAVGEALDAKDQLTFAQPRISGSLSAGQQKVLEEVLSLIKNDFAFYKHRFEIGTTDSTSGYYMVNFTVSGAEAGVEISAEVMKAGKSLGKDSVSAQGTKVRDEGHKLADAIYRRITGKGSIFREKIVFVSDRSTMGKDTRKELYIMDFDGRRVERLTFFNSTVISPAISPDNRFIIFSLIQSHMTGDRKGKENKNIDLKIYDRETRKFSTVSGHPGVNSGAAYSASGKSIYFTLTTSGNADIYEMDLATKKLRKVTTHYAEDVDPTVTADGNSMSFLSSRAGRAHIYIMNPNGPDNDKNVRRVSFVGQFNASPRYSPDGKSIVFTSWVDSGFDLYRIDAQGNNLARLTKNFGSNEEPWWSPDGEFVIFTSQRVLSRSKAIQDIYIMNRDGEVLGQLTQDFGRTFTPRWTN